MSITKKEVAHVANLARLELSEQELEKYSKEIDKILTWIDQLSEVDTSDVKHEDHTPVLLMHADVVTEENMQSAVLANAPEKEYGYFSVKKVIE